MIAPDAEPIGNRNPYKRVDLGRRRPAPEAPCTEAECWARSEAQWAKDFCEGKCERD